MWENKEVEKMKGGNKKIDTIIELTATGKNASGKTRCLNKIKPFLENIGLKVKFSNENEHKLIISEVCSDKGC